MVRATLILSAVLTVAMMSWGALCAPTPAVLPHPSMEMMQDAQMLWRTVTHQNILPGTLHSVNPEVGVTARWHEFLRRDGRATLAYIVEELKDIQFRSFLEGRYGKPTMAVSERREQFVARRLVNAFIEQHYPANQLRWGRTGPNFISLRRLADVAVSQEAERYLEHVRGPGGAGHPPNFDEGGDQSW
ncbi:hypothetical protein PANT_5c00142 [Moesziomyces antarcticus T-34]|uniref:Uncharacterized protein n=1 Tax=Pseudozyma antarctica (strain T-34) TaxID=1151754 RepID=M9LKG0_PSEA3|nr:hypothetical protein PANT_5c00142 [Moesziomyces antarcticus T-34]